VSRTVQESNVFIRLGIVLSEKQIPRFIGNVNSYELRLESLEWTLVLCKQGVTGSIPVTSAIFLFCPRHLVVRAGATTVKEARVCSYFQARRILCCSAYPASNCRALF